MSTEPDTQQPRRARSYLRRAAKLSLLLLVLMLLGITAVSVATYLAYEHVVRLGSPGESVAITIPEGLSGKAVGQLLANQGLVEHELFFRLAMKLDKTGRPIKHGYYRLPLGLSPAQLLTHLQEGTQWRMSPEEIPDELKVTIPEGLTIQQMAAQFDDPEAFREAAADPQLIARLGLEVPTLEGFLMPNTYYFEEKPDERAVVERLLNQFLREYGILRKDIPEAAGRDLLEVVTVASLIEEECRVDEERPLVSAVIYNRLKAGMPLDLDSTLQFASGKYGARMLNEDKETDSPYNTYRHAGLPPGPISNPGVACLRAALKPAAVDYLFFVSNADGKTHTFSSTMNEHANAVRRFRREIAVQRRALRERQTRGEGPDAH